MNVAELIKTMRTRSGLSVVELAAKMGVTTNQIYTWESGKTIPGSEKLLAVARATGYQLIFRKAGFKYMEEDDK